MSLQQLRSLLGSNYEVPRYFTLRGNERNGGLLYSEQSLTNLLTNTEHNIYVHINPTTCHRPSVKASAKDVTALANVLIDIDPVAPYPSVESALESVKASMEDLIPGSTSAASVVMSGRGCQIWLHFRQVSLDGGEDLRSLCQRATTSFLRLLNPGASGCRVDTSCSDVSRVARMPWSVNQKTKQTAYILSQGASRLDPGLLFEFDPGPPDNSHLPDLNSTTSLGYVLPYVTLTAARFLSDGVPSPGRHAAAYAAASSLRELNVPKETTELWVTKGGLCCDPPLSPGECIRVVSSAYHGRWTK